MEKFFEEVIENQVAIFLISRPIPPEHEFWSWIRGVYDKLREDFDDKELYPYINFPSWEEFKSIFREVPDFSFVPLPNNIPSRDGMCLNFLGKTVLSRGLLNDTEKRELSLRHEVIHFLFNGWPNPLLNESMTYYLTMIWPRKLLFRTPYTKIIEEIHGEIGHNISTIQAYDAGEYTLLREKLGDRLINLFELAEIAWVANLKSYRAYRAYQNELAGYFEDPDEKVAYSLDFVIGYIWKNRNSEEILETIEQRLKEMLSE